MARVQPIGVHLFVEHIHADGGDVCIGKISVVLNRCLAQKLSRVLVRILGVRLTLIPVELIPVPRREERNTKVVLAGQPRV